MPDVTSVRLDRKRTLPAGERAIVITMRKYFSNDERCSGCGSLEADNDVQFAAAKSRIRVCSQCLKELRSGRLVDGTE